MQTPPYEVLEPAPSPDPVKLIAPCPTCGSALARWDDDRATWVITGYLNDDNAIDCSSCDLFSCQQATLAGLAEFTQED